ncbi:MAG: hypothetical protein HYU66_22505 [Armatimonadetes bacterium]|nr:hypothetical protein [Armatimonadota bacterium]
MIRLFLALAALGLAAVYVLLRRKHAAHWAVPAAVHALKTFFVVRPRPVHVLFAFVDHFEPSRGAAPPEVAEARLQRWLDLWPEVAARHRDSHGRPPQHTWFYPWDEWCDGEVAALSGLCYEGLGEVELHLHHDGDTSAGLGDKLEAARRAFGRCGALSEGFGFVHGNWCLDNSRPDGRWCGVNDELAVLRRAGCYADFTLPTPDRTQPRMVNVAYRASDDPERPFSHDRGTPLRAGHAAAGDLLLIPGPLGFNLRDWHHRWYPALERGEIACSSPVTSARVDFWERCGVGVRGRNDWVFVKVHGHGCLERDHEAMLGAQRHLLHDLLERRCADGERRVLHYCTARELCNLALAAEEGCAGDPEEYRDHRIGPPVNRFLRSRTPVEVRTLSEPRGEIRHAGDGPVDWSLRIGPVAALRGPVQTVRWDGDVVDVDADGPVELVRRITPRSS